MHFACWTANWSITKLGNVWKKLGNALSNFRREVKESVKWIYHGVMSERECSESHLIVPAKHGYDYQIVANALPGSNVYFKIFLINAFWPNNYFLRKQDWNAKGAFTCSRFCALTCWTQADIPKISTESWYRSQITTPKTWWFLTKGLSNVTWRKGNDNIAKLIDFFVKWLSKWKVLKLNKNDDPESFKDKFRLEPKVDRTCVFGRDWLKKRSTPAIREGTKRNGQTKWNTASVLGPSRAIAESSKEEERRRHMAEVPR